MKTRDRLLSLCSLMGLVAVSAPVFAADGALKVGGFVDAQFQQSSRPENNFGFLVNDGAIYLTRDSDDVDFKVDIPFRLWNKSGPDFDIGKVRAQAYVGQKYKNGLRWKLGQFDTIFGFEANDTVDIAFTRQGSVYNFTDPFVHAGLLVGYDVSKEFAINLLVAAPNDTGVLSAGKNPHFGAQLAYNGSFRGTAGLMTSKNALTNRYDYLADFTLGVTISGLAVDAEFNYSKLTSEVTPNDPTVELPAGIGSLLNVVYSFENTDLSFGARGEFVKSLSRGDARVPGDRLDQQILVFVGPQLALNKDFKIKLDYQFQSDKAFGSTETVVTHGGALAGVYRF